MELSLNNLDLICNHIGKYGLPDEMIIYGDEKDALQWDDFFKSNKVAAIVHAPVSEVEFNSIKYNGVTFILIQI